MKLFFKKIAIFILVLSFVAVPLTACGAPDKEIEGVTFEDTMFAYTGEDHSLLMRIILIKIMVCIIRLVRCLVQVTLLKLLTL